MKVVDIHPEELIDKLAAGSLTGVERERLDAHLGQCSACRFEIAVRSDLTFDAPAAAQRPQLTFTGAAGKDSVAGTPRARPAPPASLSVRPRARHRWPLMMLAAALVLCAGGAMAAVLTGAVGGGWRPWSPEANGAVSGAAEAKPVRKVKRLADKPAPAPAPASVSNAGSLASLASQASAAPPPARVVAPIAPTPVRVQRADAGHAAADHARPAVNGAVATGTVATDDAVPAATSAAEATAPRGNPAAALFADANRARRDGNLDRAVVLYRALQSRYPSSSESELSRALLAQLLLERGNPEAALTDFDRYLAEGTPVLGAEALVGRARALEQLGKSTSAAAAWRQVQTRFPGSVHARLAATRLAALGMR